MTGQDEIILRLSRNSVLRILTAVHNVIRECKLDLEDHERLPSDVKRIILESDLQNHRELYDDIRRQMEEQ